MKAVLVDRPFSDPNRVFERKHDGIRCGALRRAVEFRGRVRITPHRGGDGASMFASACEHGWERLIAERAASPCVATRDTPPFVGEDLPRQALWAKPELVGQIAFTEWTRDGKLRHPRFQGLRTDKPAREVVREVPS